MPSAQRTLLGFSESITVTQGVHTHSHPFVSDSHIASKMLETYRSEWKEKTNMPCSYALCSLVVVGPQYQINLDANLHQCNEQWWHFFFDCEGDIYCCLFATFFLGLPSYLEALILLPNNNKIIDEIWSGFAFLNTSLPIITFKFSQLNNSIAQIWFGNRFFYFCSHLSSVWRFANANMRQNW